MKVHKKSIDFTNFDFSKTKEGLANEKAIEEADYPDYNVKSIALDDIEFNPQNTRFNDEDTEEEIEELAANIKFYGLFHPVAVFPHGDKYMLFSGERRTKAFKVLNRKFIPAMIFPDEGEISNMERLYQANLQSRMLNTRKRFLAFKDLKMFYENQANAHQSDSKLAEKLKMTRTTYNKYLELYQNAEDGDIELLESGEISWDEFVRHTMDIISDNNRNQIKRRIEIIAKKSDNIVAKNYIHPESKAVYSIEQDENGKYCTAVTNINLYKVPLHFQNQEYDSFDDAQVALDLFADANNFVIYKGDFSEYRLSPSEDSQFSESSHNPVPDSNTDIDDTGINESLPQSTSDSSTVESESSTESSVTNETLSEEESTNLDLDHDTSEENNAVSDSSDEKDENDEDTGISISTDENKNRSLNSEESEEKEEDTAENKATNNDSDYLKQFARFSGFGINDGLPHHGALVYSGTKAYIITHLDVDSGKEYGKATKKTTALYVEVNPKTVRINFEV